MATNQYTAMRIINRELVQSSTGETWRLWVELSDDAEESSQGELLVIRTHITGPTPGTSRGWELMAVKRVHALLGERLKKMQHNGAA